MRRSFVLRFARRNFAGASPSVARQEPLPDMRAVRDAQVAAARERLFGPQGSMPGDRHLRKRLEGKKLMRWYFPSKYHMQDFRVDDYYEMQAERLAPRETHRCADALAQSLRKVSTHREELRAFFQKLDEATFLCNPTLQDLYGLFRLVDPDKALKFTVPEAVFREHSPLFSGDSAPLQVEPFASDADLHLEIESKLGGLDGAAAFGARVQRQQSPEAVKELLMEAKNKHHVVPNFERVVVAAEPDVEVARSGAATGVAAAESGLRAYTAKKSASALASERAKVKVEASRELKSLLKDRQMRKYLKIRHRFIDPMFRRRRLKWLERQVAGKNKANEVKFNSYYAPHPDDQPEWPTNKGSVTVVWPSPYH